MILTAFLFAGVVKVVLPNEVHVRGTELSLGQIAKIDSDDPALKARVEKVALGYAPAPGYTRLFSADRMLADLSREFDGVKITVGGESACRVFPEIERVRSEAIEAAARAELTAKLKDFDALANLSELITGVDVPAGAEPATLVASLPPESVRPGLVSVPVKVMVDKNAYRTVWTTWKVELWELRPVLKRGVHAGETLDADLFEQRRVPVGAQFTQKRLDARQLTGAVASRELAAQSVVAEGDVLRPTVVQKGDSVFLTIRKGSISARVAAIAQESGSLGDRIRVELQDKTRILTGAISARDTVEIDLSPQS